MEAEASKAAEPVGAAEAKLARVEEVLGIKEAEAALDAKGGRAQLVDLEVNPHHMCRASHVPTREWPVRACHETRSHECGWGFRAAPARGPPNPQSSTVNPPRPAPRGQLPFHETVNRNPQA